MVQKWQKSDVWFDNSLCSKSHFSISVGTISSIKVLLNSFLSVEESFISISLSFFTVNRIIMMGQKCRKVQLFLLFFQYSK